LLTKRALGRLCLVINKELIHTLQLSRRLVERIIPAKWKLQTLLWWLGLVASTWAFAGLSATNHTANAVVRTEFIFERAPFAQSHASTLAETDGGLVAAWFGGSRERDPDVGIWLAHRTMQGWSKPVEVAYGLQADGKRYPCWNPVLFQVQKGPLLLFYKIGPDPARWWGMRMRSTDGGYHWSRPVRLPEGILGPAKNKPIQLADGTLLSPSSSEQGRWQLHIERSHDRGQSWQRDPALPGAEEFEAIQPTLLDYSGGRLQLLARSRQGRIVESWSENSGATWSKLTASKLPNPNSGIDAVLLRDGRAVLVYNPTRFRRSPLRVAISGDGSHWHDVLTLEDGWGEYSYPAVIQSADGLVHVTYTWKRERIKHVAIDPASL
jgi:predicted neuraminidase